MFLFTQYISVCGLPLSPVSLSRCITCQDVCVQQLHAGILYIDFKWSQIAHHNKSLLLYNKNRAVDSGTRGPVVPRPPFKICAPHFTFGPRLLYTSNIAFKKCCPLVGFGPLAAKSWRRVRLKTQKISVTNKKYECAYLIWNDNRILV